MPSKAVGAVSAERPRPRALGWFPHDGHAPPTAARPSSLWSRPLDLSELGGPAVAGAAALGISQLDPYVVADRHLVEQARRASDCITANRLDQPLALCDQLWGPRPGPA